MAEKVERRLATILIADDDELLDKFEKFEDCAHIPKLLPCPCRRNVNADFRAGKERL